MQASPTVIPLISFEIKSMLSMLSCQSVLSVQMTAVRAMCLDLNAKSPSKSLKFILKEKSEFTPYVCVLFFIESKLRVYLECLILFL